MRPGDRWLVGALFLLALGLLFLLGPEQRGRRLVVERDGQVIFVAPLDQPRQVRLKGPLGETELEIREGKACILSSPCSHKVCIGMGRIAAAGELLACVPNHLLVRIEGEPPEENDDYDLLSR